MKLGVLFSGGKDSTYAAWIEKNKGNEIACLISLFSTNKESYMFHTPNITQVSKQAKVMNLPLLIGKTKGEKELELADLKKIIIQAKRKYKIEGIITGALHSNYQASRIQKICDDLSLKCINPLWHKDETLYLNELIKNKFKVVITAVAAFPLDEKWLGREIDYKFVNEILKLHEKYKIHPAGEGGEFETLVLNCPFFKKELKIKSKKIINEGNAWRIDVELD